MAASCFILAVELDADDLGSVSCSIGGGLRRIAFDLAVAFVRRIALQILVLPQSHQSLYRIQETPSHWSQSAVGRVTMTKASILQCI